MGAVKKKGQKGQKEKAKPRNAEEKGPPLQLVWTLDELPSSQHKTGLAGLVLMLRWLSRKPKAQKRGILRLVKVDSSSATVELDREGLGWLLDESYAAEMIEIERDVPWKGTPYLRIVEREVVDPKKLNKKTGKPIVKQQKKYVYRVVQPQGALAADSDPQGPDGPWIKLWRDFVWGVLRAVPATRAPYNARAEGEESDDAEDAWLALTRPTSKSVELPSTYFVGAQAVTAENVAFKDRERFQFLLHFWPFAVGLAVPMTVDRDGKSQFVGHVLSFSDIADLETFCDEYTHVLQHRGKDVLAYLPKQVVLDLPAEAGLQFLNALRARIKAAEGKKATRDLVLGVDVFHIEREGNNVRTRSTMRVEPSDVLQDEYERIRGSCRDPVFRRQLLSNLLAGAPWSAGFDRLFATLPSSVFLRGRTEDGRFPSQFPFDVQRELKHHTQKEASDV